MATLPNIEVTLNDWTSLNTLSSTTAGTALSVQNEGLNWFLLFESSTKPDANSSSGISVTSLVYGNTSAKDIDTGSEEIWIRPKEYGTVIRLSVQEI